MPLSFACTLLVPSAAVLTYADIPMAVEPQGTLVVTVSYRDQLPAVLQVAPVTGDYTLLSRSVR